MRDQRRHRLWNVYANGSKVADQWLGESVELSGRHVGHPDAVLECDALGAGVEEVEAITQVVGTLAAAVDDLRHECMICFYAGPEGFGADVGGGASAEEDGILGVGSFVVGLYN